MEYNEIKSMYLGLEDNQIYRQVVRDAFNLSTSHLGNYVDEQEYLSANNGHQCKYLCGNC